MSTTSPVTVHYTQAILLAAERLTLPLPAELLELSGRPLNRKLATSFKLLRDQVLCPMAKQLLRESPRLSEVAERLGFSDESAFAKAFRRWSSMTPGQFRQGLVE